MTSAQSADPRVGTELAGYRIEALLGRGGMSDVYQAFDLRLKRRVALKLLSTELAKDERFRERFLRESELAASIDHSHITPIYDAGETDGLLYLAMRYVEGTDLRTVLELEGRLDPARALALVDQAASALDAAHARGLVHRDVKPGNILVTREEGSGAEHVYLSDFGLGRQASSKSGLTETGQFLGTVDYAAPEQIERGPLDGRADVYALGCVLYECLTGEAPYRGDSVMGVLWAHAHGEPPRASERRPDLSPAVDAVIAKALAKEPEERYASCRELVAAARAALGVPAQRARPLSPGSGARAWKWLKCELAIEAEGEMAPPSARVWKWGVVGFSIFVLAVGGIAGGLIVAHGGETADASPTLAVTADSLQRIDLKTNRLAATIRLGASPSGVAVGEGAVWVANHDDQTVTRIDPAKNTAVTIPAGGHPLSLAVGKRTIWVGTDVGLTTINPDTNTTSIGELFRGGVWSIGAAGEAAWVLSGDTLNRLGGGGAVLRRIPVGGAAGDYVAVGEAGVWLLRRGSKIWRIDPVTGAVVVKIDLPGGPYGIAVGGGRVWVTDVLGDTVWRIDPGTNGIAETIDVGDRPLGIAFGEEAVWVANYQDGTVSRIDPKLGQVVATIPVGPHPTDVAVGEGGVWVTVLPE